VFSILMVSNLCALYTRNLCRYFLQHADLPPVHAAEGADPAVGGLYKVVTHSLKAHGFNRNVKCDLLVSPKVCLQMVNMYE
jgi:hypothetical protein